MGETNKLDKLLNTIILGDSLEEIDKLQENSVDSIVTDPPYELNFMGKGWDNAGISFNTEIWSKCLRVLKPGGHLLAFGGSRTFHRIACAIEDSGFEIRDTIMWLYGSGFPKSMSLGKVIEGKLTIGSANVKDIKKLDGTKEKVSCGFNKTGKETGYRDKEYEMYKTNVNYRTDLGKQYNGWGTALKPAFEPIIVARKPFKGSLVDNVIKWGVGGLNIDECRVGTEERVQQQAGFIRRGRTDEEVFMGTDKSKPKELYGTVVGRFPANLILTYEQMTFDEVCGGFPNTNPSKQIIGGANRKSQTQEGRISDGGWKETNRTKKTEGYNDNGGSASRYFYCAKASKKDRDEGLEEFETKKVNDGRKKDIDNAFQRGTTLRHNTHPTVKPTELMQYLIRLVTPNNGIILDPFMGSGSTGKACMYENREHNKNYRFIGIEKEKEYYEIAKQRIKNVDRLE